MTAFTAATAITKALGEGWHAEAGGWSNGTDAYLCGPDGERIHLMVDRYQLKQGSGEFSGSLNPELHQQIPYNAKLPRATISLSKSPERIAREIERRLLPTYREILTIVTERKARNDHNEATRQALIEKLAGILGDGSRNHYGTLHLGNYDEPLHGDIEIHYGGSEATFTLRASATLAIALTEAIATIRQLDSGERAEFERNLAKFSSGEEV